MTVEQLIIYLLDLENKNYDYEVRVNKLKPTTITKNSRDYIIKNEILSLFLNNTIIDMELWEDAKTYIVELNTSDYDNYYIHIYK